MVLGLPVCLALAGCTAGEGGAMPWDTLRGASAAAATPASPAQPARPADPLAAFAGRAAPGQQESVALPEGGRVAVVRMVRSYNAASGRECRELAIGGAADGRSLLYCQDPAAGWVAARPLLRGGAIGRS